MTYLPLNIYSYTSLVPRHTFGSFFLVKNSLILLGTTPRSLDDFGFNTIGWWVSSGPCSLGLRVTLSDTFWRRFLLKRPESVSSRFFGKVANYFHV